jgi:hypothetical protein
MFRWPPPKHVGIYIDRISMCIVLDQRVDNNLRDMHGTNNTVNSTTVVLGGYTNLFITLCTFDLEKGTLLRRVPKTHGVTEGSR